jgi:hypothetical protein
VQVPEVLPETPEEVSRFEGALRRREHRQAEAARRKQAKLETAVQEEPADNQS